MITNYFNTSHDTGPKAKVQPSNKKSKASRIQNAKFKPEWSKIFPSIFYDDENKAMFCRDCKTANLSNSFTIGCQTMLKDNIQKHIRSADHKKALQTKHLKTDWDQGLATANKHHESDVTGAMSSIYWMAKNNQPSSLFPEVNDLLEHHVRE